MESHLGSLEWHWRAPDWPVAAGAGFAAGAVLMVLDLLWSSIAAGGGPWQTSHLIAAIFLGPESLPSSGYSFSVGVVALALATHYVLGIGFGLMLAAIMGPLNLDTTAGRAMLAGALFGVVLYLVNFYGMVRWFPWFVGLRGGATFVAHLVFGIVAALLYRAIERPVRKP